MKKIYFILTLLTSYLLFAPVNVLAAGTNQKQGEYVLPTEIIIAFFVVIVILFTIAFFVCKRRAYNEIKEKYYLNEFGTGITKPETLNEAETEKAKDLAFKNSIRGKL